MAARPAVAENRVHPADCAKCQSDTAVPGCCLRRWVAATFLVLGVGVSRLVGSVRRARLVLPPDSAVIAPIQTLYDSLLSVMKAGPATPFAQRYEMLAPPVDRALDMPTILQVSVGLAWNELPAEQTGRAAGRVPPLYDQLLCQQLRQL